MLKKEVLKKLNTGKQMNVDCLHYRHPRILFPDDPATALSSFIAVILAFFVEGRHGHKLQEQQTSFDVA